MLTNLRMVRGYDETADEFLKLAKSFREKPDRKGAYTDVMRAVTPRILKNHATDAGRRNSASKQGGTNQ